MLCYPVNRDNRVATNLIISRDEGNFFSGGGGGEAGLLAKINKP